MSSWYWLTGAGRYPEFAHYQNLPILVMNIPNTTWSCYMFITIFCRVSGFQYGNFKWFCEYWTRGPGSRVSKIIMMFFRDKTKCNEGWFQWCHKVANGNYLVSRCKRSYSGFSVGNCWNRYARWFCHIPVNWNWQNWWSKDENNIG